MSDLARAPYLLLPEKLCADLRDNPIALGVYALIARQFFITHESIPLSAGDLMHFDPELSYGQARRALERLSKAGWIICTALGRKNTYLPSWGIIAGSPRPWCHNAERLGRPAHVRTIRFEASVLDSIGRILPHHCLRAVVYAGQKTATLASIGQTALSSARMVVQQNISSITSVSNEHGSTDQLIDQLIGNDAACMGINSAAECLETPCEGRAIAMPWDSWDHEINQHATLDEKHDSMQVAQSLSSLRTSIPSEQGVGKLKSNEGTTCGCTRFEPCLNTQIQSAHQQLNAEHVIAAGEWLELYALQEMHGVDRMLIWQARIQRRHVSTGRITPSYYQACAAADACEQLPRQYAPSNHELGGAGEHGIQDSSVEEQVPMLEQRLRALGIHATYKLRGVSMQLLEQWEALAGQPAWRHLGDDPPAVARAMLLRGLPPPTGAQLQRRALQSTAGSAPDWAQIIADSGGYARSGADMSDMVVLDEEVPEDAQIAYTAQVASASKKSVDDDREEQLRCLFRLHAAGRASFQAVESMHIRVHDHHIELRAVHVEQKDMLKKLVHVLRGHIPEYHVSIV